MNQRNGFLDQPTRVTGPFPSIQTLYEDNCVSLNNFHLYVEYVPSYKEHSEYFKSELKSAINKINQGMPGNLQIWLTDIEKHIINEIIKVIQSQSQEYFDRKPIFSEQKPKTVCPVLLAYLKRMKIINGGKTRRRTNKQKRRKYSHKSKKTTRSRYHKRK